MDPDPPPAPSPAKQPEPNHVTSESNHVSNHVTSSPDPVTPQPEHVTQPAVQHVSDHDATPVPPVAAVVQRPKESIPVINHVPQSSPPKVVIFVL